MKTILKQFIDGPLFDACTAMLNHLHINFNEVTRTPIPFGNLYPGTPPKALREIMTKVEHTYFIGTVDESSLLGHVSKQDEGDVTRQAAQGRYVGMMIFAADIAQGQTLNRTEMATLTRGFNRIAAAQPVVLFIRQGSRLALATCERSEYTQQWRDGEKLGKVCLLRNINCNKTDRGHIDILESIGDKAYPTFEDLYKHWIEVFSSELLTKKFYGELSDWYAWAVQVARFPNDLTTDTDDDKFNHESCIRLITRLIFVWFLKQKHLIPEEFFDEQYIKEHFIEEFNPHDRRNLLYNPERSLYYRLILQNLFFAMLNCPIAAEGKDTGGNRRFRGDSQKGFLRDGYNVNNLMRYKSDFKEGGAEEFVQMANSHVPFLNGGLFDCLDRKPEKLYYDGFSERKESLEQLYLPDWLFFGDEVGRSIDLSEWYGDNNKRSVSARGIIDILKRYHFTIEENTPLDQEVSLDPELLGKAFENLLASYNPETKTSARKQTGSFYTPREIVQYMVDESLVAHLKRICGDELESEYRKLLSYSTEETTLNEEQRKAIMQAVYNCRVLDPACGSGAFPMGILGQMVHVLRQLDPTNEMWRDFMTNLAIEQSKLALAEDEEEERKARLADIDEAFNTSINDPDYARKLYLIEHCIYGVDIQPIAVQISKLRFFISLVVDQNPTDDAAHNFGIRPLPNLESKFVAANTLIPVGYDASLFESTDEIISKKTKLKELNHLIFLAKRNVDKQRLKEEIKETRQALAKAIEDTGYVSQGAAQLLANWDMFDQNTSSPFFDPEWMFGVKDGFDIVIANPPYISIQGMNDWMKKTYKSLYKFFYHRYDIFACFVELGLKLLSQGGTLSFIQPSVFLNSKSFMYCREYIVKQCTISILNLLKDGVFEMAVVPTMIMNIQNKRASDNHRIICSQNDTRKTYKIKQKAFLQTEANVFNLDLDEETEAFVHKTELDCERLGDIARISRAINVGDYSKYLFEEPNIGYIKVLKGASIYKWTYEYKGYYLKPCFNEFVSCGDIDALKMPKLMMKRVGIYPNVCYDETGIAGLDTIYTIRLLTKSYSPLYIMGLLNSKLIGVVFRKRVPLKGNVFPEFRIFDLNQQIPIKKATSSQQQQIIDVVNEILAAKQANPNANTISQEQEIDCLVYHLYGLTYDEVLIVDPDTPITREEYENQK